MPETTILQGQADAAHLPYETVDQNDFTPDPDRLNHVRHTDGTTYHVSTAAYEYLTGRKSAFVNTTVPVSADTTIMLQRQVNELDAELARLRGAQAPQVPGPEIN